MFNELLALITESANDGFLNATEKLENFIYSTDNFSYSREQAITELIKATKVNEKIRQIDLYVRGISRA